MRKNIILLTTIFLILIPVICCSKNNNELALVSELEVYHSVLKQRVNEIEFKLSDKLPLILQYDLNREMGEYYLMLGDSQKSFKYLAEAKKLLPNIANSNKFLDHDLINFIDDLYFTLAGAVISDVKPDGCHDSQLSVSYGASDQLKVAKSIVDQYLRLEPNNPTALWLKEKVLNKGFLTNTNFTQNIKNITPNSGIKNKSYNGGLLIEDLNNDGWLDIVSTSIDGSIRYYKNTGEGVFIDLTIESGLDKIMGGQNIVQADYNNDGFVDFFISRGGWLGKFGRLSNILVQNNGDGTFADVTRQSGLAEINYPTISAAWGDYNNDGYIDLFIANQWNKGIDESIREKLNSSFNNKQVLKKYPNQLMLNNKDGTFTDIAKDVNLNDNKYTVGASWGDVNRDGWLDMLVSNSSVSNQLFINHKGVKFEEKSNDYNINNSTQSYLGWFLDFNNDGYEDIFSSSYTEKMDTILNSRNHQLDSSYLFKQDREGKFVDVGAKLGLKSPSSTGALNYADIDANGFLDVFVGYRSYRNYDILPSLVYYNQNGEKFLVEEFGGFVHSVSNAAFGDIDNDGDEDIYVKTGSWWGESSCDQLYENSTTNSWIAVKLRGVDSNSSAIGARIRIVTDDDSLKEIHRTVKSGGTSGSNSLRQEIGLAQSSRIKELEVYWPSSNKKQLFKGVEVNQIIEITEGKEGIIQK